MFMLNCIYVYDETGKLAFLNFAERLNNYLMQNSQSIDGKDFSTIHYINHFQIILRKRNFNSSEKRQLINLKKTTTDVRAICCILILSGYDEEFKINFEKLNEEEQKLFKSWPIFKLVN